MQAVSPRGWLYARALADAAGVPWAHVDPGSESWDGFVQCLEALRQRVGDEVLRRLAGGLQETAAASQTLLLAGRLIATPQALYRAVVHWLCPAVVALPRYDFESLDGQRCRITVTIDAPHVPSPAYFLICAGMFEAIPRLMGLPRATLTLELHPRSAVMSVHTPPGRRSLGDRVRRVRKIVGALGGAVSELAKQETSLRDSLDRLERLEHGFRGMIDGLLDPVLVHRDGVIVYANPAVRAALGLGESDPLIGRHLGELAPRQELTMGSRLALLKGQSDEVLFDILSVQAVDFDGPATLVVARDVTRRRALEVRLAVADRMLSMGTLAAGVAHEINNPLSYVIANLRTASRTLERLPGRLPEPEHTALADMLGDAQEGAERVRAIVADLGSFARPDDGTIGTIEVQEVVERTVKLADNQLRHRARLVRQIEAVPPVRGNEAHLGQVLLNLLINAAQATAEQPGGDRAVGISVRRAGERVQIAISDSGPGIPDAERARIFDPYYSSRPMGVGGLGLSICHGLVTGMGGTIEVDSRLGVGTTFTVSLRLAPGPRRHAPPSHPPPPAEAGRLRILVIDDELRVARALARALEGFDVTVEDNGERALARLLSGEDFDLVFCDLMMPTMSGMALHAELSQRRPGYQDRLVFMTGGAFTPEASDFLKSVDNRCLAKPFGLEQVLALVRAM